MNRVAAIQRLGPAALRGRSGPLNGIRDAIARL